MVRRQSWHSNRPYEVILGTTDNRLNLLQHWVFPRQSGFRTEPNYPTDYSKGSLKVLKLNTYYTSWHLKLQKLLLITYIIQFFIFIFSTFVCCEQPLAHSHALLCVQNVMKSKRIWAIFTNIVQLKYRRRYFLFLFFTD